MTVTIGVSLKAYLNHQQTLDWSLAVSRLVNARAVSGVELFVLPAFPSLTQARSIFAGSGVAVGAQDLAADDAGNQTGEVTASMLTSMGCTYAEVGHAERLRGQGETEAVVAAKTATALQHGLTPVLCVGESTRQRPADAAVEAVRQLRRAVGGHSGQRLVVAYEPHWAIGAKEPASDHHILTVAAALRDAVTTISPDSSVIYGGSAGPGLLSRLDGGVDGLFLGRFAHDPEALGHVLDEAAAAATGRTWTGPASQTTADAAGQTLWAAQTEKGALI